MSGIPLAAVVPLSGCGVLGRYCTDVGWLEGLTVQLEGMAGGLPGGRYEITVVGDGASVAYDLDLTAGRNPYPGTWYEMSAPTDGGRILEVRVAPSLSSMPVWVFWAAGGGPTEVSIRVRWQGTEVGSATFRPQYTREEINGPGCGVATRATDDLKLDVPAPTYADGGVRDAGPP
jgi:hypothetical protein